MDKTWTSKYLFNEVKGKAVCLVRGEQVAVLMHYNLNQHYWTVVRISTSDIQPDFNALVQARRQHFSH